MAQKHNIDTKEYPMTRDGRIQGPSRRYRRLRHPSFPATLWAAKNPLLQRGEIGYETDTHKAKIGDGITYWNNLGYVEAGASWGDIAGNIADQTDLTQYVTDAVSGKVNIDGTSVMTAPLKFASGSMRGAVGPYLNGVGFWKMDAQGNITLNATLSDTQFIPTSGTVDLGNSTKNWKNLYLSDTIYLLYSGSTGGFLRSAGAGVTLGVHSGSADTAVVVVDEFSLRPVSSGSTTLGAEFQKWGTVYTSSINNGYDIAVPVTNSADTLALKSEVDLAANSGRMITDQGLWYAKMYAATVAPAAEDGTNYADFSQVDGQGNPVIVTYNRVSGAWVQDQTIIPPAEYDGYVPITSKIWDIAEQAGQQGGRILWNHQSKEFTPYPQIISFEDIEITGESTVIMPLTPGTNQIVNKDYVDTLVSNSIGDATITLTQGGQTMGSFTTNQSGDATIALDGGSSYHPDLFDWKWADHICNDVQWLRADTWSWQSGAVYQAAFNELFYDIQISTYWYRSGGPAYTKSRTPAVGDAVYLNSDLTTQIGTVEAYDDANDEITVSGDTYTFMSNTYVTPTTETVAGYSVSVYTGHSGRKIVAAADATAVDNIYTATGVAWYYIIDIPGKRFKLPRVNPNSELFIKTAPVVVDNQNSTNPYGSGLLVNNEDGNINFFAYSSGLGAVNPAVASESTIANNPTLKTNISDGESYYAGKMYLYFYVGEFTQTALENTAGITAETLNDKVDVGHQVIAFQAPTADNNNTWYRKYADGWVEQGGSGVSANVDIALPVTMADTNYTAPMPGITAYSSTAGIGADAIVITKTTTTIKYGVMSAFGFAFDWEVRGMAA